MADKRGFGVRSEERSMRQLTTWMLMGTILVFAAVGCGPHAGKGAATPQAEVVQPLDLQPLQGSDADQFRAALRQFDDGHAEEATKTLEELRARHPNHAAVLHELGLAYRSTKRPDKTVELLMPYRDREELPELTLAALGSALDETGKRAEAEALLRQGIKRHPNSGLLYSELATTLESQEKWQDALELHLRGTQVEPTFAANYLHLAVLFSQSDAPGMALVYGETFRLLEPKTSRSQEVAKLIVEVCRRSVKLEKKGKKTEGQVSLAPKETTATMEGHGSDVRLKMPMPLALELAFGPGLVSAHIDGFGLASLHRARRAFLDFVKKDASNKTVSVDWNTMPVFRWLRDLDAAGHLEAYDYWLYGPALPDELARWEKTHGAQVEAFHRYQAEHPLFPPPRPR
jgi:tetratricopeptide (TPR) repeat protein